MAKMIMDKGPENEERDMLTCFRYMCFNGGGL